VEVGAIVAVDVVDGWRPLPAPSARSGDHSNVSIFAMISSSVSPPGSK
jgi:hypothetical protein